MNLKISVAPSSHWLPLPAAGIFLWMMLSITCSYGQSITYYRLNAPDKHFSDVKTIAVLDYKHNTFGQGSAKYGQGRLLANKIIACLEDSQRYISRSNELSFFWEINTAFYRVIDLSSHKNLLAEYGLDTKVGTNKGIAHDAVFALGKALGVDLIIYGDNKVTTEESRTETPDGISEKTQKYYTTKVVANASSGSRAFLIGSEETTTLGLAHDTEIAKERSTALRKNYDHLRKDAIVGSYSNMANDIVNRFAPYVAEASATFEKVEDKKKRKKIKQLIKAKEVDILYQAYNDELQSDPNQPDILFNIGLLHEIVGNSTLAKQHYSQAYAIETKGKYKRALEGISQSIEIMESLNVRLPGYSFAQTNTSE